MTLKEFKIVEHWEKEITRAVGVKRAVRLIEAARTSTGIREGLRTAKQEMDFLLAKYEMLMEQYEKIMDLVEELARQIPGIEEMLKINWEIVLIEVSTTKGFVYPFLRILIF